MKKIIFIIVFLSCVFYGKTQVFVTESEAVTATSKYMQHYLDDTSFQARDVSHVDVLKKEGHVLLYEVCYKNGCSALVSGVKSVRPVLGYNVNGDSMKFIQNGGMNGLSFFVGKFALGIEKCISIKKDTILDEWKELLKDTLVHSRNRSIYGPLLTSHWKQGSSNDGQQNAYNCFVPSYCDNVNKCYAGCVPVAMAQIMNYWKYPVWRPDKAIQYDWCNMPDKLNYWENYPYVTNDNYETERDAIARLIADCGSAANVHYCIFNSCESFAWPANARDAFVNKFNYHSDADLIRRIWHLQTWKNTIMQNITAGRPVFYAAMEDQITNGGHAFVCDGYNSETDLFHFNWGGGTSGSWVSIDDINSGGDDWTDLERAIVDIHPNDTQQNYCNYTLPLETHYTWYYNLLGYTAPAPYENVPGTFTFLASVPDTLNYPATWRTIPNGAVSEYTAHEEILLQNGFFAEEGSDFYAHIVPCPSCSNQVTQQGMVAGTPLLPNGYDNMPWQDSSETSVSEPQARQSLNVWPNPVSGMLHIQLPDAEQGIAQISVCDLLGKIVMQKENLNHSELDVSLLPSGMYLLRVRTTDGTGMTAKFVKE